MKASPQARLQALVQALRQLSLQMKRRSLLSPKLENVMKKPAESLVLF
jgi:hypothetical protein